MRTSRLKGEMEAKNEAKSGWNKKTRKAKRINRRQRKKKKKKKRRDGSNKVKYSKVINLLKVIESNNKDGGSSNRIAKFAVWVELLAGCFLPFKVENPPIEKSVGVSNRNP